MNLGVLRVSVLSNINFFVTNKKCHYHIMLVDTMFIPVCMIPLL
jgi:hypothetical protein